MTDRDEPAGIAPDDAEDARKLPDDVCSALFTKTMHLNTHHRRSAFEHRFTASTALFHCICTMSGQGPDEDDVDPGKCRPGRSCYVTEAPPPDLT